jgi:hypothetical protein
MGTIVVKDGTVKYVTGGVAYYVKQNFAPSIQVFEAEVPQKKRKGIPETFFSNGPVEKLVSLLGLSRCNVVLVKLASDLDLSPSERDQLTEAVGPNFYFSRDARSYRKESLPHDDPEIAAGFQVVLDTVVRNWDGGARNMVTVDGVPVWFDFGASLDPRYQNVFRFVLQLEESRREGRASSIVNYFMDYSRRRSQILKRASSAFAEITRTEIRTILKISQVQIPAYFGEYVVNNIKRVSEDIDILRGAFLRENVLKRPHGRT